MNGDYSLSLAGSGPDVDTVKTLFQKFIADLRAAGATVSSGAFSSSQTVETLDELALTAAQNPAPAPAPATDPAVTP